MTLEFVDEYINKKIKENNEFIRYTFYELRIKNNLTEQEIEKFLELNKNYFEKKNYAVYFTDDKFEFENAKRTVQPNELMIAIKKENKEKYNGRKNKTTKYR